MVIMIVNLIKETVGCMQYSGRELIRSLDAFYECLCF